MRMLPVGTKVRTRYKYFGRGRHCRGVVESRTGHYVYVRLNYKGGTKKGILIECYDSELEKVY